MRKFVVKYYNSMKELYVTFSQKYKIVYFALFLMITASFVTAVAFVGYNITAPVIEANNVERIETNIAILYSPDDGFTRNEDQEDNSYNEKKKGYEVINAVYEVLDSEGNVHVVIYNVTTQGRNGFVSALIAVNPYNDTIEAVTYYKHGETPNIGEKYTRDDAISKLIGQNVDTVEVDLIVGATTTWGAVNEMFEILKLHYNQEEVHIDG